MLTSPLTPPILAQALQATQISYTQTDKAQTLEKQARPATSTFTENIRASAQNFFKTVLDTLYLFIYSSKADRAQEDLELNVMKNFTTYAGENITAHSEEIYSTEQVYTVQKSAYRFKPAEKSNSDFFALHTANKNISTYLLSIPLIQNISELFGTAQTYQEEDSLYCSKYAVHFEDRIGISVAA